MRFLLIAILIFLLTGSCSHRPPAGEPNCSCRGIASFYNLHGRTTASGEKMDSKAMTAAHRCLPFGTQVNVCLAKNPSQCVQVTINDRGPYHGDRIIDLSKGAAHKLGFSGITEVLIDPCK